MTNCFRKYKEHVVYLMIWAILFLAPVISMYLEVRSGKEIQFVWKPVVDIWKIYILYLVAFLIHNFLIAPILVDKKKAGKYLILASSLVVVFFFAQSYLRPEPHHHNQRAKTERRAKPTQACGRADSMAKANAPLTPEDSALAAEGRWNQRRHRHYGPPPMIELIDFLGSAMLIMLLGLNLGVKLYLKQERDEKNHSELEQRHLQEQLAYLRYQINPHFFMNTLNNIHALIDIDPEKAKSTIVRLSRLMRYMLYESNHILVPLGRELTFLNHYIALMKMRYSEKVVITVDFPDNLPDCMVPPLLYVTFVENAFKHGVSYEQESFIYIALNMEHGRVDFHCTNSKPAAHALQAKKPGGVGLTNVRRRLMLIYGSDYNLEINDGEKTYEVRLCLPPHPKRQKELIPDDDGHNANPENNITHDKNISNRR